MKYSKAQILTKFHKIPKIQFEDQQLTSFSGIVIFQRLFKNINLKNMKFSTQLINSVSSGKATSKDSKVNRTHCTS